MVMLEIVESKLETTNLGFSVWGPGLRVWGRGFRA